MANISAVFGGQLDAWEQVKVFERLLCTNEEHGSVNFDFCDPSFKV